MELYGLWRRKKGFSRRNNHGRVQAWRLCLQEMGRELRWGDRWG